jgi:hypothetical protein
MTSPAAVTREWHASTVISDAMSPAQQAMPTVANERVRRTISRAAVCILLAIVFAFAGAVRIAETYSDFSSTYDEPNHIASGIELLSRGTYTYSLEHTPMARIAIAIGPYLTGARLPADSGTAAWENFVMKSGAGYLRNLQLARFGTLPFYLLTCFGLFVWARRLAGGEVAAASVGLLSLTPPVLAHSGLATTDGAAMAAMCVVVPAFERWLERPGSAGRSALLGLAGGLALGTKISTIPFFGAIAFTMLLVRALDQRRRAAQDELRSAPRHLVRGVVLAIVIALTLLSASYGFSYNRKLDFPAPLSEFVLAVLYVVWHNGLGNPSYLLGEVYVGGRWDFFPIAMAVKTPIPLLILGLGGIAIATRRWWREKVSAWLTIPLALLLPLGIASASGINLGLRHILAIYPPLALLGGVGVIALWRQSRATRAGVVGLLLWMFTSTWQSHPDYLPYFNEFASKDPGAVLVESDLDWGQDLERLADTVRARGITNLSLAYFGNGDRPEQLFSHVRRLKVGDPPPTGWIAVSETLLRRGFAPYENRTFHLYPGSFAWLQPYQPVARVGRSIRLYFIPPRTGAAPSSRASLR